VGRKEEQIKKQLEEVNNHLAELERQKSRGNALLSPEQKAEIRKFRAKKVAFAKQLRELKKDLKRRKDELATWLTLANILAVPLLVILVGFGVFLSRRSATRAR